MHHIRISPNSAGFCTTSNDAPHPQKYHSRALFEANIDAIVITDTLGIITDINQQMIALTGYSRSQLLGSSWFSFCLDPLAASVAFGQALTEDRASRVELLVKNCDGVETPVFYNAAPIYGDSTDLLGVFATLRDATELNHMKLELEIKSQEVARAEQMKSNFLATMSHELRTPLTAILGFSEALLCGILGNIGDNQKEYIQDIHSSGRHLLNLINDILDLAKIDAGLMPLRLESANLTDVLSYSIKHNFDQLDAARLEMAIDDGGVPIVAQIDLRKTQRIIEHMLSNAAKFSAPNGNVRIHACRVARSSVGKLSSHRAVYGHPLPASDVAEFLQLTVNDDGVGIAEESLPKVYDRFTQVESGLERQFEGAGLGVTMVQHLAAMHGGTTAIASLPGAGTNFAVWLPIH